LSLRVMFDTQTFMSVVKFIYATKIQIFVGKTENKDSYSASNLSITFSESQICQIIWKHRF